MIPEAPQVKVLFIAGTGRSGTTLLSNILGQVPGCLSAGEVRYVWERGVVADHRCGCGKPFSQCPVWGVVRREVPTGRDVTLASAVAGRLDERMRVRRVPLMILRRLGGKPALRSHPDDSTVLRVYQTLADLSGVDIIVDSSKLPPYAMLLASLAGIDLYVVHVVRDPRANAFSWRRKKVTNDTDAHTTMPQVEVWRSAVLWVLWNFLVDAWWPRGSTHRLLVRYEDLIHEPAATCNRVLDMLGLSLPAGLITGRGVKLAGTHSVAGNPSRHESGDIELHADDEWRQAMGALDRAVVTMISLPWLRRYGYSLQSVSRRRSIYAP